MWCRYVDVNNLGWSKSSSEGNRFFYVLCFIWGRKMAPVYVVWARAGAGGKSMLGVHEVKGELWQNTWEGERKTKVWKEAQKVTDEEMWCIVGMTAERREGENGEMPPWREKRMTLMAFGLGAFSFYEKHELNIARGTAAGQAMVRHTKQSWQKHWFSPSSSSKPLH